MGLLAMVVACAVTCEPARAAACPGADALYVPGVNDAQLRAGLLCLVNNERLSRGLTPVVAHPALDRAAQRHLEDMAARDYLGHIAPEPAPFGATPHERAAAAGYPGTRNTPNWEVGETLHTASQTLPVTDAGLMTARAAMTSWMTSTSHCAVILTRELEHLGAGVLRSSAEVGWVTDSFALVVGATGLKMTPSAQCPATTGLVDPTTVPAAPLETGAGESPAEAPAAPADGVALGTTGVQLTSGSAITLNRGAAAAPMTLRCTRTAGRCRATATLRARGRVLGHANVDLTAGAAKRLTVPIARGQRKRLTRHRTRAILHVATTDATSTRAVTLRG